MLLKQLDKFNEFTEFNEDFWKNSIRLASTCSHLDWHPEAV